MQPLDKRARLQELARLLGGSEVTRNTLANAKNCWRRKLLPPEGLSSQQKRRKTDSKRFLKVMKVYYHRHINMSHGTAQARKEQSLCAVRKTLTAAAAVLLMLTAGCSTLERVVYRPDINQELSYTTDNRQKCVLVWSGADDDRSFWYELWFYVFRQRRDMKRICSRL